MTLPTRLLVQALRRHEAYAAVRLLATQPDAAVAAPQKAAAEPPKGALDRLGEVYIPAAAGKNWKLVPADFKEFPERDVTNYPHPNMAEFPSKVRMGFVPDSWFKFFYGKTGETGGYLFLGGLSAALLSTETIVMEHGIAKMVPGAIMFYILHHFLGAPVARAMDEMLDDDSLKNKRDWHASQLANFKSVKETEASLQSSYQQITDMLFTAKRENVHLQLEAAYRERLAEVHQTVKRRLEFLAEYESTRRRFEQQHMVDWIIGQVRAGITPQLEAAALKQCVADLKTLAKTA